MKIWLILLLGGLATYLTRLSMILLFTHWQIPPWLGRALRLVPAAVFPPSSPKRFSSKMAGSTFLSITNAS